VRSRDKWLERRPERYLPTPIDHHDDALARTGRDTSESRLYGHVRQMVVEDRPDLAGLRPDFMHAEMVLSTSARSVFREGKPAMSCIPDVFSFRGTRSVAIVGTIADRCCRSVMPSASSNNRSPPCRSRWRAFRSVIRLLWHGECDRAVLEAGSAHMQWGVRRCSRPET